MLDRPISNESYLVNGIILIVEQAEVADAQMTTMDEQMTTTNEENKRFGVQEYFKNL